MDKSMCDKKNRAIRTQGFTLVELSIVIIVIGFLIAGITAGRSLVKQAQLHSIISDLQNYQIAYLSFFSLYGQAPGDFTAGGEIWSNCGTIPAYCNGNGNGIIEPVTGDTNETLSVWKQLSLSGIISNSGFDAVDPSAVNAQGVLLLGRNMPVSRQIDNAGYIMVVGDDNGTLGVVGGYLNHGPTGLWDDGVTNAIFIGGPYGGSTLLIQGIITSMDAFNLDQKMDDGKINGSILSGAQSGSFRTIEGFNVTGDCLIGGNVAQAPSANTYNSNGNGLSCIVAFALN